MLAKVRLHRSMKNNFGLAEEVRDALREQMLYVQLERRNFLCLWEEY